MANIEMKTGVAGLEFGWAVGDVLTIGQDVDPDEAARWVTAEFAVATDKPRGLRVKPSEHVPNEVEVAKSVRRRVERAVKTVARKVAPKAGKGKAGK